MPKTVDAQFSRHYADIVKYPSRHTPQFIECATNEDCSKIIGSLARSIIAYYAQSPSRISVSIISHYPNSPFYKGIERKNIIPDYVTGSENQVISAATNLYDNKTRPEKYKKYQFLLVDNGPYATNDITHDTSQNFRYIANQGRKNGIFLYMAYKKSEYARMHHLIKNFNSPQYRLHFS